MRWLVAIVVLASACGDDPPEGECTDGETRPCYDGPPGTEGVGACATGIETCAGGTFPGVCIGDVVPFVESCDGVDQDCNGVVDDAEGTGVACTNASGCDGATACVGASITCVGPEPNECDVCGGAPVADLGGVCTANNCAGELVCNLAGDGTTCDAPIENACGLCGGPAIVGLDDDCNVGCPGINVCSDDGESLVCNCNPQPGMCRDNGVFRAVISPQVGELVITELMPSPSGDQSKREWFEVLVTADVDLNQLGLDRVSDTNVPPDLVASVDCIHVTAGTRLVFARSAVTADNGGLPTVTGTFGFTMLAGSPANPGDVRLLIGNTVIDAVTWTGSTNDKALQLDPDSTSAAANDDESTFCTARTTYGDGDFGTPGADNVQCVGATECLVTGGAVRARVAPVVGDLVITEMMPSPSGDQTKQEWIEVEVKTNVDLNGVAIDRVADTRAPDPITTADDCFPVTAGQRLVFARSAVTAENGGLPAVTSTFGLTLVAGTVANPGDVRLVLGAATLDAVTWTDSTSAKSLQLDLGTIDPVSNDSETNLCDATASYNATDLGTPGLANAVCPPGPGECLGSDGFRRTIDKPTAGQLVISEIMVNPDTPDDSTAEFFEIANIGPGPFDLNGLGLKGASATINTITSAACKTIAQDGFAVFGRTANLTDNGGIVVDATFTFSLTNSNSSVSVLDDLGVALDVVTWATEPVAGRSRVVVDGSLTTTDNDTQSNFCDTPVTAANDIDGAGPGINFGSPGTRGSCN